MRTRAVYRRLVRLHGSGAAVPRPNRGGRGEPPHAHAAQVVLGLRKGQRPPRPPDPPSYSRVSFLTLKP